MTIQNIYQAITSEETTGVAFQMGLEQSKQLSVYEKMSLYKKILKGGFSEVAKTLLERQIITSGLENENRETALFLTAKYGFDQLTAKALTLFGKIPYILQHKNCYGWTPLHAAIRSQDFATVEQLLDSGARLDAADNEGVSAFGLALKTNLHLAQSIILSHIQKGQPFYPGPFLKSFAELSYEDQQEIAAMIGLEPYFVEQLIGLSLNEKFSLFKKLSKNHSPWAAALLQKSGLSLKTQDKEGNFLLHLAAKYGDVASTRFLLKNSLGRYDYNTYNKERETPFCLAMRHARVEVIEQMISFARAPHAPCIDIVTAMNAYSFLPAEKQEIMNKVLPIDALLDIKMAVNIWGIRGEFSFECFKDEYEGAHPCMFPRLVRLFSEFAQETSQPQLIKQLGFSFETLMEAPIEEQAKAVREGRPFLIQLDAQFHVIYLLLSDQKFYLCNRGYGSAIPGVFGHIFNIQKEGILEVFLEKIREKAGKAESFDYFNSSRLFVDLAATVSSDSIQIEMPAQTVGNCFFAGFEAAIVAGVYAAATQGGASHSEAEESGFAVQDQFTNWVKRKTIQNQQLPKEIRQAISEEIFQNPLYAGGDWDDVAESLSKQVSDE